MKYEFETTVERAIVVGRFKRTMGDDGYERQDYVFDQIEMSGGHEHEDADANFQVTIPRDALSPRVDQKVKVTVELLNE